MKLEFCLSIGYSTAMQREIVEINNVDLIDLTAVEREIYIEEYLHEWSNNYIETWHEKVEE